MYASLQILCLVIKWYVGTHCVSIVYLFSVMRRYRTNETMLEVVIGVMVMEVDKVADEGTDMEVV